MRPPDRARQLAPSSLRHPSAVSHGIWVSFMESSQFDQTCHFVENQSLCFKVNVIPRSPSLQTPIHAGRKCGGRGDQLVGHLRPVFNFNVPFQFLQGEWMACVSSVPSILPIKPRHRPGLNIVSGTLLTTQAWQGGWEPLTRMWRSRPLLPAAVKGQYPLCLQATRAPEHSWVVKIKANHGQ